MYPTNAIRDHGAVALLVEAFARVFAMPSPRPFGGAIGRHQGVSDDAQGVQWNAGVDRERSVATIGVNLEGKEYDNWPIARFIERELQHVGLPSMVRTLADADRAELWWSRDAWQFTARPPIREENIGPDPPVPLDRLTADLWRTMLNEAYDCLDPARKHRGRAKQWVTFENGSRKINGVSPHLQIKRIIWRQAPTSVDAAVKALTNGRDALNAVYNFVRDRTA